MRKLIAAMKTSVDGKIEGPEGYADWVDAWSEDYGLTPRIDACVVGGRMYPGYEHYWTTLDQGQPTPAEREWSDVAARLPHYVVSSTLTETAWPNTTILPGLDAVAELKQQPGKDIYLMGGAALTAGAIEADLLDELHLIVYPLVAGEGKPLFSTAKRHTLELQDVRQLPGGLVNLVYTLR
ncbi:dihydrofolate reductase family protein [Nonomuraea sp. NPDC050556]|uniref:dihydrofolate reductase family protein n=1 Tax=Nonomuraea sp. NPDC050556 TaxID=3364369 RepID=UPI0037961606